MYAKTFKTEKCLNLDENLHNTNEVNLQFIALNLLYDVALCCFIMLRLAITKMFLALLQKLQKTGLGFTKKRSKSFLLGFSQKQGFYQ